MDRRDLLQVRVKSLAAEARILRHKERSLKKHGPLKDGRLERFNVLEYRRRVEVRRESRHHHLAYACLRRTPYLKVEQKCQEKANFGRVKQILHLFLSDGDPRGWNTAKETADLMVSHWEEEIGTDRKALAAAKVAAAVAREPVPVTAS